jgi:phosphatidylserine/phosphatidylglycerophosphate/cardiolipin synthase-like enzyme
MMASRFLFNEALWDELGARIPKAKAVRAGVAYLGTGASALLPLRKGDKLVVDLSLRAVRSGTTDPREIQKFLRRGVEVFSRGSLHAKFFIIDKTTIAGSSNISKNAKDSLDEAAVLTDDPATTRRALATFEQLCTEPVRKDYLQKCLKEYRPTGFTREACSRQSLDRRRPAIS